MLGIKIINIINKFLTQLGKDNKTNEINDKKLIKLRVT